MLGFLLIFSAIIIGVIFIIYTLVLPFFVLGSVISNSVEAVNTLTSSINQIISESEFEDVYNQVDIGAPPINITTDGILTIQPSSLQHIRLVGNIIPVGESTSVIEIVTNNPPYLYIRSEPEFTHVYRIDSNSGWAEDVTVNVPLLRQTAFTGQYMIPIKANTNSIYKFKVPVWARNLITKSGSFKLSQSTGIKTINLNIYATNRIILTCEGGWEAFSLTKNIIDSITI
jgi:hypothetical protein